MNRLAHLLNVAVPDQTWAEGHWRKWEALNRFSIQPMKRSYQKGQWPQDKRDHYVALFPKSQIGDFLDFIAYEFFHASLLQNIVADENYDGSWFRLETMDLFSKRLLTFLASQKAVLTSEQISEWLRAWELPDALLWMLDIPHQRGLIREDVSESTLWTETEDGYLVFLVING